MLGVVNSEVHHCREYRLEVIENLCHGRYLPVEVFAEDMNVEGKHGGFGAGIYPHGDSFIVEAEPGDAEPEVFGDCHELLEGWDRKAKLVEEVDFERHQERSGHVRKQRLQVLADAREGKPAEVRKCDVGYDPLERYFSPDIAVRRRGTEANLKRLELRQEG